MPDEPYTFNELSNDDRQLLLANGYTLEEATPGLLADLRQQDDGEDGGATADEMDGTQ